MLVRASSPLGDWDAQIRVKEDTMQATSHLKLCPLCGSYRLAYHGFAIHCGRRSAIGPFAATEDQTIML
jgi:ribosomal protein S27AE